MVWGEMDWFLTSWSVLVTWTAFSAFPVPINQMAWHMSVGVMREGQPPEDLARVGQSLERILLMVEWFTPVAIEIWWVDWPKSKKEMIWLVWSLERDFKVVEVVKEMMFGCVYIMLNSLCITWPLDDIITLCNIWFSYFARSATKLLQWYRQLKMGVSPQPLDQITWPKLL